MAIFEKLQWRLDMIEKIRNTFASQYRVTCSASGSEGYEEAPTLPANVRERALRQLAAARTDNDNHCNDMVY